MKVLQLCPDLLRFVWQGVVQQPLQTHMRRVGVRMYTPAGQRLPVAELPSQEPQQQAVVGQVQRLQADGLLGVDQRLRQTALCFVEQGAQPQHRRGSGLFARRQVLLGHIEPVVEQRTLGQGEQKRVVVRASAAGFFERGLGLVILLQCVQLLHEGQHGFTGSIAPYRDPLAQPREPFVRPPRDTTGGDLTTFQYYTVTSFSTNNPDETGYRTGDLWKSTNPLGHVTEYLLYNKAGQPRQWRDGNSVASTSQYDERQRLTSSTIGGETTLREYWPSGLLKRVTQPDGSFQAYGYDDAHRLVSVTDNLGNSVTYTLDNLGNRKAEEVRDPDNVLRRALARSIDALGRVQQVTGRE
ncbi:hypothetical protein D621_01375 [beta proteobacterium AAP51]|nr:hypothetical protein D621_01375 [beta proteobacterium AAP51]